MKKIIFFFSFLIPILATSQTEVVPTSTQNYTHKIVYKDAYTETNVSQATNDKKIETIQYYDGLGRPIQSVAVKQGGKDDLGKDTDIITHIEYDAYGRQAKDYLPIPTTVNNGKYKTINVLNDIQDYYHTEYIGEWTSNTNANPYSERQFEASPLNRVLKQAAPGEDWKLGNGNEIEFDYQSNSTDEVRLFTVSLSTDNITYTPTLNENGFYLPNTLYKTITLDENYDSNISTKDHTTEEFKDKQGRVVLKRTYTDMDINGDGDTNDAGETEVPHDTYYVYDDYSNLTYVLPPKMEATTSSLSSLSSKMSELGYKYKYDRRNRLIEKKIPGKDWEYIIYNLLDQPVLTQDGNGRVKSPDEWIFTKYDAFGRVAYTGRKAIDKSRSSYQEDYADNLNGTYEQFENKETSYQNLGGVDIYYSNEAIPTGVDEIYTINYYDDYAFDLPTGLSHTVTTSYGVTSTTNTKGLATGTKVKVLGTSNWIITVTYYDEHKRPIYVFSKNNYLSTTDIIESDLDFLGQVIETKSTHKKTGKSDIVTIEKFTYDHSGRLTEHTHNVNGQKEEVLASNEYDELGQLKRKKVGGAANDELQVVDCTYNIRGWVKEINDVTNLGSDDLFAFKISYNKIDDDFYGHVEPLYNGNISETFWITKSDNYLRGYGYNYDELNRLKNALYEEPNNPTYLSTNERIYKYPGYYNTRFVKYDKNGNITYLLRFGKAENDELRVLDRLNYSYLYNSNKLASVTDGDFDIDGFYDGNTSGDDYIYDDNGNLKTDANKGITNITYNHLNLPTLINFGSTGKIDYFYDASGAKLKKKVTDGSSVITTDYAGNYIYEDNQLQFFSHPEGYIKDDNDTYNYVYQYKDHLGNIRLSYSDANGDGDIDVTTDPLMNELIEENNYYPFGLKHKGYNSGVSSIGNSMAQNWDFQGQERTEDLGLNVLEFKYRIHDPAIGRFWQVDPLAEEYVYNGVYNFSENRVVDAVELEGLEAFLIHGTTQSNSGTVFSSAAERQLQRIGGNTYTDDKFSWGTLSQINNNKTHRKSAALNLVKHVVNTRRRLIEEGTITSDEPVTLIGYSHGGNVEIQAVEDISKELGIDINLITVSTPAYNETGHQENAAEKEGINEHIQIVHENDAVTSTYALGSSDDHYLSGENHKTANYPVTEQDVNLNGSIESHTKLPAHPDFAKFLENITPIESITPKK